MLLGRLCCFFAGVLVVLLLAIAGPPMSGAADVATVRADAEWVLAGQCPDGAIANHPPYGTVQPYLGNFAALGLVRAAKVTGELRYATAAWKWLIWYQGHMDASGFIDDWTNNGCRLRDAGVRDSTDAPAGLFLLALLAAQRSFPKAVGGTPELPRFASGITRALGAIEATQDADGLTWAKPGYPVKYLMDQSEAYAGLVAAGELARMLANAGIAERAARDAGRLYRGVDGLWDPATGSYVWAVHASGQREAATWSVLDPDAVQQVWAIAFGLAGGDRPTRIMNRFLREQPDWSKPATLARYRAGSQPTGYWAVAGWALLQTGSTAESQAAAASIRAGALAAGRAWPFSSGDAGQLILLESGDAGYLGDAADLRKPEPAPSPSPLPALAPSASSRSAMPSPSPSPTTPSGTAAASTRHRGRGGLVPALLIAAGAMIVAGGWWLRRRPVA